MTDDQGSLINPPKGPANRLPEFPARFLLRRGVFQLAELLEELLLLGSQLGRSPDMHAHVQVAMTTLAQARQPLVAKPIGDAGLRSRLEAQSRLTVRRRHLDLITERRLRECDGEVVDEIVAMPFEARILFDVEDVDLNRLFAFHAPIAAAARAGIMDHASLAPARRTG